MAEVRMIDLTEAYRILDGIKDPSPRVTAAREKILDELLRLVDSIQQWEFVPRRVTDAADLIKKTLEEADIPKNPQL